MQPHRNQIALSAGALLLAMFSVSCSLMPLRSSGNTHGMQRNPDPRYQQQPYYQGQRQLQYGGQRGQPRSASGYGDSGYPSSPGDYGYPTAPSYDAPPAGGGAGSSHVVAQGDTLWSISKKYGTSVAAIRSANSLSSDLIRPGDVLQIP
jgi:nucleoid-associated protein YgaU